MFRKAASCCTTSIIACPQGHDGSPYYPCAPDMDLMIEAKDKEQAVFELMKTFRLPGHELINDMVPHEREDENKAPVKKKKPKPRRLCNC